ncbi:MAG TPA: tripartite tricarboxylate transporter substrate-binding protein [Alphaproteobacteria bacterium]|nr:tripartite tricarboxylate transporter substrate-binding protein [Alphaproteobacteria bacterium]
MAWRHTGRILGILAACAAALAPATVAAADGTPYYKDKTVTFYIGFPPGGGYDLPMRTFVRFMSDHLPGKPLIVPRNMPGAGSRTLAGYLYNVAPRDGTAVGTIDQSVPLQQAMGEKLQFDNAEFTWIGNIASGINVVLVWADSGITTIEDAKRREVTIASSGSGSSRQPKIMNNVIGTKFKIIAGYQGNDINVALERGEVDGRTNSWATLKAFSAEWLRDRKVNILVQVGLEKAPDLPNTPLLMDLAANDDDRTILRLVSAQGAIGKPILSTPGLPPERVAMLRTAFDETMRDANFLSEAKKQRFELNPMSGADLERIIRNVVATPPPMAKRLAELLDEGG